MLMCYINALCIMGLKNDPLSLFVMSLQHICKLILTPCEKWYENAYHDPSYEYGSQFAFTWDTLHYHGKYCDFAESIKREIQTSIPSTIFNQLFDLIIDTHARRIVEINKEANCNLRLPSISWVINTLITNNLHRLNLNCLRHIGIVKDEELRDLENVLLNEIPKMTNLTEISLHTSGTENTLPICNDEIMKQIGTSCPNLRTLDIPYNHNVTDVGLKYLIPNFTQIGCPILSKITLFECSVTIEGVANLLIGMPCLKFLSFRETGQCIMFLSKHNLMGTERKLQLAHVNNLGIIGRTCKDIYRLSFNSSMSNAISKYCPKITGLKVRVSDSEVEYLEQLNSVCILDLVYNIGRPSSPGIKTIQYISNCGTQLISLSIASDNFSTKYLKVIGENCVNLKRLWIRCNNFICEDVISKSDKQKCNLSYLQVFFFRIASKEHEVSTVPLSVINYVLHKTKDLQELVLSMKNSIFTDSYIEELFNSINTSKLKHIMILVPFINTVCSSIHLTMMSVEIIMQKCPQLDQLGNLLVWDISEEEICEQIRHLKLVNSALKLFSKQMFS